MVLSESYLFVMMSLYGRFQECGSQCNALFFVIALLAFAWHIDAIAPQNTPRKLLAVVPGKAQAPTTAAAVPVESFALQHQPAKNVNGTSATQQVQFTVFHPANCSQATDAQQRWCQRLPVLFLVNGANVRAQDYTTYATLLAQRGYTFVASDYYQQLPPTFPQAPLPSICPRGQILAASAALISTFLSYANTSKALPAVQGVQQRGIVLVGHSLGGTTIMDILNRDCGPSGKPSVARSIGVDTCEGYQPMLRTASSNGSSSAAACPVPARASPSLAPLAAAGGGTVAEASSQGQPNATMSPSPPQTPLAAAAGATAGARAASGAASGAQQGVVLGAVVYEGYKSKLPPQGAPYSAYTAAGVTVPPGTFLLYMAGQYGINKTAAAYADTNTTSCACAGLAAFAGVNHYGIANWQPNGTQITPCGVKASFDPQNFTVSENVQTQQLQRMAALTDSFIRAAVFRDTKLRQGPAAGYSLQLKGQCFV